MVSVPARRAGVAYATGKGLSQRRACMLLGVGRSALHYCSTKLAKGCAGAGADGGVGGTISAPWLYRRIAIFLAATVRRMSFGRVHRLWRQARLQVPRKRRPRKRIATGAHARTRRRAPTRVVVRLRVRLVCQRSAVEVPDGHRRMDQGGSRDRGRWPHPLGSRHRGAFAAYQRARRAALFAFGQWPWSLSPAPC